MRKALPPSSLSMIGSFPGCARSGLKTTYLSGLTVPWTTVSPRPQAALMTMASGNPVSVSIENMTPEPDKSERTICWMPIERATSRVRKSVVWGKSVSVLVALGGRRTIKKQNYQLHYITIDTITNIITHHLYLQEYPTQHKQ